jgi:nicotinate-nucleotide adenylyltransferase
MVIGLYFGSFNPVHDGHVHLSKIFQQQSKLDQVWWVLSPHNPFKATKDLAAFEHRAMMVNLVLPVGHWLCKIEDGLSKPSYTIQTLRALQSQYPENEWSILMGSDSWNALPTWKEGSLIENEFPIWVYPRQEGSANEMVLRKGSCNVLQGGFIPVSSSEIREWLIKGQEKPQGVSVEVWDYMVEHGLYLDLI